MAPNSGDLFDKCLSRHSANFKDMEDLIAQYKLLPGLTGPVGPHMKCGSETMINWSCNDYLGLTNHPSNREIEIAGVQSSPANTPMGSRLLTNHPAFNALERTFSEFIGTEDSAVFATGYLAAVGVIPALLGPGDTIILDAEGHSCLYDAAKIAMANGAKFKLYRHNDMTDLEDTLKLVRRDPHAGILIVCDGVYSMKGDLSLLDKMVELKNKYGARLLVDDAHGGGVMGPLGKGTAHHFDKSNEVDLVMHVFSKAFGSIGGCVSGSKKIIDFLRNNTRTYIFSHSMQLVFVEKMLNSLKLIEQQPELITQLWDNTQYLQSSLIDAEFDIGTTQSPITPVIFKLTKGREDFVNLFKFITELRAQYQIYASIVSYPAVPREIALIRMTPTALHTKDDINQTINAFTALRRLVL